SGKTASITTPLITTILPTLRAFSFDSGMRLLERWFRNRTWSAKALQKPRQCIEARRDEAHAGEPSVLLERRHPGGVVEASADRGDERRDHASTVPAITLLLRVRHRLRCRCQDVRALPARPSETTGRGD